MPYAGRLQRLQESLTAHNLDALIVTSAAQVRHLTGVAGPSIRLLVSASDAVVLVHFLDLVLADAKIRGLRLRRYDDSLAEIAEFLERWKARRVGFEAESLAYGEFLRWSERLPTVHLISADALLARLRGRTDSAELIAIRQAVALADRAIASARAILGPGITEAHVAGELAREVLAGGAERLAYLLVQFGANTAQPQARPGSAQLQPGDLILIDLSPVVDGSRANLARTMVLGPASAEQRRAYEAVHQAQIAALHQIRPGVKGAQVDRAAREVIASTGYGRYFGHGVGQGLVGTDSLSPRSDTLLQEGMAVTIGPGVYIPGWGGIRIEDTIVVRQGGCDVLASSSTDLVQVPLTSGQWPVTSRHSPVVSGQ